MQKDQKPGQPTAGNLPDRQEEFENSTWNEKENKDSTATEAERVNVSKTLPETACREETCREEKKPDSNS